MTNQPRCHPTSICADYNAINTLCLTISWNHTHSRLSPEQEEFLSSSHLIVINSDRTRVVHNPSFEQHKGYRRDATPRRFQGTETPLIITIKTTATLRSVINNYRRTRRGGLPHAKHIDKMLLSNIVLFVHVPLERGEDITFLHKVFTRPALNLN